VWPPEALTFLRELENNNDRDWFRANRSRYDAQLAEPARAMAEQLAHLGQPHFFRAYNDTRFHARPPIKEQYAVSIGHGAPAGYYFALSLDGLFVGAGLHHPATDQLERFRAAIDEDRRAEEFERAVQSAGETGLALIAPALKRAPRGYPPDHPRVDRLRLKDLTVLHRHELGPWLHEPECDRRVREQLESARPLVQWLGERVGPSSRATR
jgi:uncharacterized protein (TIGR02453 family)